MRSILTTLLLLVTACATTKQPAQQRTPSQDVAAEVAPPKPSEVEVLVEHLAHQGLKTPATDQRFAATFLSRKQKWSQWRIYKDNPAGNQYVQAVFTSDGRLFGGPEKTRLLMGHDHRGLACAVGITSDDSSYGHLPNTTFVQRIKDLSKESLAGINLMFAHQKGLGARIYSPNSSSRDVGVESSTAANGDMIVEISHRAHGIEIRNIEMNGVAFNVFNNGPGWYTEKVRFTFDLNRIKAIELAASNALDADAGKTKTSLADCVID